LKTNAILDWYDGVVTAIVELPRHQGQFLASLVSWVPQRCERTYVFVPLSDGEAQQIERGLDAWQSLVERWRALLTGRAALRGIFDTCTQSFVGAFDEVRSTGSTLFVDIETAIANAEAHEA
jgi:hypothetical protein